ncbi:hypothetical protein N4G37_14620, partial [Enterococcus faecalis]|uniref:hypothetical protein n=1 Tax=Enterococcus faecalis TaxID=1351 RepID=UPI0021B09429
LQGGYGDNPLIALTKTGTPTSPPETNKLAALGTANLNVTSPNADTLFDTKIAVAPVAIVTNLGTGVRQLNLSDVRHLNS